MLSDRLGHGVFMFAHIPLFYLIYRQLADPHAEFFIKGFDVFMMIHLVLHILFLKHKKNEFKDWISWSIIVGAGLCGLIDIILSP